MPRASVAGSVASLAAYLKNTPVATGLPGSYGIHAKQWSITRACFRWVCHNIAYDKAKLKAEGSANIPCRAEEVLKCRKTICSGYADLFQELLGQTGCFFAGGGRWWHVNGEETRLPEADKGDAAVTMCGLAKGSSWTNHRPGSDEFKNLKWRSHHAWNAVRIGGRWHLMEATWAAGSSQGSVFVRKFKEHHWDARPEVFVMEHLPDPAFPALQVMRAGKKPWGLLEFAESPDIWAAFFALGFDFGNATSRKQWIVVKNNNGQATLTFTGPPNAQMITSLEKGPREWEDAVEVEQQDGARRTFTLTMKMPERGEFELTLYGNGGQTTASGSTHYEGIVKYNVVWE